MSDYEKKAKKFCKEKGAEFISISFPSSVMYGFSVPLIRLTFKKHGNIQTVTRESWKRVKKECWWV